MKKIVFLFLLLITGNSFSTEYFYHVQEGDQVGIILLSLGHKYIWSKDGKINQFKKSSQVRVPNLIQKGAILKILDKDIIFNKNVTIDNGHITFVRKMRTLGEYEDYLKNEAVPSIKAGHEKELDIRVVQDNVPPEKPLHSFNFYPGMGFFVAHNKEIDRQVTTTTFPGIQPIIQLKGIYSSDLFGSLSIDLFTKKIINQQFSFPLNIDYRVQIVPKWNTAGEFRLALSHSLLRHSYVGKSSALEVPYELRSQFVGIGVLHTHDNFWLEIYIEKAYKGSTKSSGYSHDVSKGYRIDTEIVYSISDKWRIIPGINYYSANSKKDNYLFSVLEARLVLSREFSL